MQSHEQVAGVDKCIYFPTVCISHMHMNCWLPVTRSFEVGNILRTDFVKKKTNSLFSHILLSIYSCWSLGLARQWCVTDLELVHDGAPSARASFMILRLHKTILSNVFFKMLKSCSCVHVNNGTSPYVYCNNNFILKNPSFFQTDHNHCFSVTLFNSLLV